MPSVLTVLGKVIDLIFDSEKASSPIVVKPSFKDTLVKLAHPKNAFLPSVLTVLGKVIDLIFDLENASSPIVVKPSFEFKSISNLRQPKNALFPICSNEFGSFISAISVPSNADSPMVARPSFKVILSKIEFRNADAPISLIDSGKIIDLTTILFAKAWAPIASTFLPLNSEGIFTFSSFPLYL